MTSLIMNLKLATMLFRHKHEQNGTQRGLIGNRIHITLAFIRELGMMHLWMQKTIIGYSFTLKIPSLIAIAIVFEMHTIVFSRLLLGLKMMVYGLTKVLLTINY